MVHFLYRLKLSKICPTDLLIKKQAHLGNLIFHPMGSPQGSFLHPRPMHGFDCLCTILAVSCASGLDYLSFSKKIHLYRKVWNSHKIKQCEKKSSIKLRKFILCHSIRKCIQYHSFILELWNWHCTAIVEIT